jgi:hypothetical protein
LKTGYGFKQEDLILYGQSVGSGPTLHLASKLQNLRGVVLHSAILSGLRVLYPVKVTFWFDIFKVSFPFQFLIGRNLFALSFAVTKVFYTVSEYRQNSVCQLSGVCYTRKYALPSMCVISLCNRVSFSSYSWSIASFWGFCPDLIFL